MSNITNFKNKKQLRTYPQSIEAEVYLISALFLDNSKIGDVIEIVNEEDFYDERNKIIFATIKNLYAEGIPVDFITVTNAIIERGLIEKAGGHAYIAETMHALPAPANAKFYAEIIKKKSILRQLISISNEIATICYDEPEDVVEVLNIAEKRLMDIYNGKNNRAIPLSDSASSLLEYLKQIKDRKYSITGVPTGFVDLDEKTSGFQKGDLVIVAGRPGMGKTAFSLNIALNAVQRGYNVGIISLEMPEKQITMRLLSILSKVELKKIRTGFFTGDDWDKVVKGLNKLQDMPIYIDDDSIVSSIEIRTKARHMKMKYNIDLLIIDYLQLIEGRDPKSSRVQQISEISRSLKLLAKDLEIPVIALSQLNRAVEQREDKRPTPADLRESGSIEQDADTILFIYRDEVYNKQAEAGVAEIIIGKQRNGPQGTIKLHFNKDITSFENLAENNDSPIPVSNPEEENLDTTASL